MRTSAFRGVTFSCAARMMHSREMFGTTICFTVFPTAIGTLCTRRLRFRGKSEESHRKSWGFKTFRIKRERRAGLTSQLRLQGLFFHANESLHKLPINPLSYIHISARKASFHFYSRAENSRKREQCRQRQEGQRGKRKNRLFLNFQESRCSFISSKRDPKRCFRRCRNRYHSRINFI